MKILHTGNLNISNQKVLSSITKSIYAVADGIESIYSIHVNYVNDSWIIDFTPKASNLPALKVSGYITEGGRGEVLRINPESLSNFPSTLSFKNYDSCSDICNKYITLLDFIVSLFDYEFEF